MPNVQNTHHAPEASPLVSIFIPYYNDEKFLGDSINAVLEQTYGNWELFLFNHASTDGSRELAHSFSDERIHHLDAELNLGAGSGLNLQKALPHMQGKYVKLLCADDILKPHGLETLMRYLEEHEQVDIVCSDMDYMDERGKELGTRWSTVNKQVEYPCDEVASLQKLFYGYSHIAYPTSMLRRTVFDKVKLDTTLVMLFDVSLWVQALVGGCKLHILEEPLVRYRVSASQVSSAHHREDTLRMVHYENYMMINMWYRFTDVALVKAVFPSGYAEALTAGDEKLIPFVVAHFLATARFKKQGNYRKICGVMKLYELMNDPDMRAAIEEKFQFTIRDFRNIYRHADKNRSWKVRLLDTNAGDLRAGQLLYLLFRRFFHFLLSPFHRR